MEAKVIRDGDILVIHLQGYIDYETVEPFKSTCESHLISQKVVFNLACLNFVGSNGITDFVSSLAHLSRANASGIKFCRVSTEFRRILEANGVNAPQFFLDESAAKASFALKTEMNIAD